MQKLYKEHFKTRNLSEYTIDGAISLPDWNKSDIKILFLLKENYGYQNCGIQQVSELAYGWIDANIVTYKRICLLAAILIQAIEQQRILTEDEILIIKYDDYLIRSALNKIAVINIKKQSGKSQSKDSEIRKEARLNAPLLNSEINKLQPNIIIAGGTVCWHGLMDTNVYGEFNCPKFDSLIVNNSILFHANHPAARNGGFNVMDIHESILKRWGMRK